MIETSKAKRIVALLVVLMAALVALSGPVAQVLDLPESTAQAKKKKKKKKKNRPPAFNVVNCAESGIFCTGTAGNDFLVGTDSIELISGVEGNDVYQANGGGDFLVDQSLTSNDLYTGYTGPFGADTIEDPGGTADYLDLVSLRALDDVTFVRSGNSLRLDGLGDNDVLIAQHFGQGRIETIRFANFTVTGTQAESLAREATPEEQTEIDERLDEAVQAASSEGQAQQRQDEKASS